ncbi:MAG: transcription termination/antitermination protein NusG [Candidatus Wallbacteria bacterium]
MERNWYVVHTYSGSEDKVKTNIMQRVETMGMKDQIFTVVVPKEKIVELKDGKRIEIERKVFPGYIYVEMMLTDDSWYVVRNTPGVTGFIGFGNKPTPLPEKDVQGIMKFLGYGEQKQEVGKSIYKVGQKARVIDGPFAGFTGVIDSVYAERHVVKLMLKIFGRDTSVELDFVQIEEA